MSIWTQNEEAKRLVKAWTLDTSRKQWGRWYSVRSNHDGTWQVSIGYNVNWFFKRSTFRFTAHDMPEDIMWIQLAAAVHLI